MTTKQREVLKKIISFDKPFAVKYMYRRSLKYRVLSIDRSPIINIDDRTFKSLFKNGFFNEEMLDVMKVYVVTEKAFNYKFRKNKKDGQE